MAKPNTRASPRLVLRPLRRMGAPAADKGHNRNAITRSIVRQPALLASRTGYPWIENAVKNENVPELLSEASFFV